MSDIRRLCDYAHRFGVRIYVTFNTLVYEEEIPQARRLLQELQAAGVDAVLVGETLMRAADIRGKLAELRGEWI